MSVPLERKSPCCPLTPHPLHGRPRACAATTSGPSRGPRGCATAPGHCKGDLYQSGLGLTVTFQVGSWVVMPVPSETGTQTPSALLLHSFSSVHLTAQYGCSGSSHYVCIAASKKERTGRDGPLPLRTLPGNCTSLHGPLSITWSNGHTYLQGMLGNVVFILGGHVQGSNPGRGEN